MKETNWKQKLSLAKKNKNDEFYTSLSVIEDELKHYKNYFKNKVIFCNCDDPEWSNFWKYFNMNFKHFELKKLIATYYDYNNRPTYKILTNEGYGTKIEKILMEENGDFRSKESIEILKQSDIIVTNPPFSLFREYVSQLIENKKKFIIIGHQNAISYKEIFNLIKANLIWLGVSITSGDREFMVPEHYEVYSKSLRIDENNNKYIKVPGIRWFTNLEHKRRKEYFLSYKKYDKNDYFVYDNYEAINIDKTNEIPSDYFGVMGVPITFMDKYNPDQFEIIGQMCTTKIDENNFGYPYISGIKKYARILIKKR